MTKDNEETTSDPWLPVIARSLAMLCLRNAKLPDKDLATRGKFLVALGVPRKDAAALLGTTYASLSELLSRAARMKGGARRGNKKKKR